jgi:hypothetical protein
MDEHSIKAVLALSYYFSKTEDPKYSEALEKVPLNVLQRGEMAVESLVYQVFDFWVTNPNRYADFRIRIARTNLK